MSANEDEDKTEWEGIIMEAIATMIYVFICCGVVASTSNVTFDELNSPRKNQYKYLIPSQPREVVTLIKKMSYQTNRSMHVFPKEFTLDVELLSVIPLLNLVEVPLMRRPRRLHLLN